jgi:hypothetical protein
MACMMALPPERQARVAELEARALALQRSRDALAAGDPQAALALLRQEGLADCGPYSQQQLLQLSGDGSEELLAVIQVINQQQEGLLGEQLHPQYGQLQEGQAESQSSSCGQEDQEEQLQQQEYWREGEIEGQYEDQEEQQQEGEEEEEEQGSEADMALALGAYDERRYQQHMQQVSCRAGWAGLVLLAAQQFAAQLPLLAHPQPSTHQWAEHTKPALLPSPQVAFLPDAPQVDVDMARRAQRGAAAGQLEAGYDSDVEEEERALLEREQALGPGGPLQQQLEQQRRQQLELQLEEQEVGLAGAGPGSVAACECNSWLVAAGCCVEAGANTFGLLLQVLWREQDEWMERYRLPGAGCDGSSHAAGGQRQPSRQRQGHCSDSGASADGEYKPQGSEWGGQHSDLGTGCTDFRQQGGCCSQDSYQHQHQHQHQQHPSSGRSFILPGSAPGSPAGQHPQQHGKWDGGLAARSCSSPGPRPVLSPADLELLQQPYVPVLSPEVLRDSIRWAALWQCLARALAAGKLEGAHWAPGAASGWTGSSSCRSLQHRSRLPAKHATAAPAAECDPAQCRQAPQPADAARAAPSRPPSPSHSSSRSGRGSGPSRLLR